MSLIKKTYLCYLNIEFLEQWIKEKSLLVSNFVKEKEKWEKEVNSRLIFFTDTELLLVNEEIMLLKIFDNSHANFLAKTYRLEYQEICKKIFQEEKNIVLITEKQWKEINEVSSPHQINNNKKLIILFKDKENIKENLTNWIKKLII